MSRLNKQYESLHPHPAKQPQATTMLNQQLNNAIFPSQAYEGLPREAAKHPGRSHTTARLGSWLLMPSGTLAWARLKQQKKASRPIMESSGLLHVRLIMLLPQVRPQLLRLSNSHPT